MRVAAGIVFDGPRKGGEEKNDQNQSEKEPEQEFAHENPRSLVDRNTKDSAVWFGSG
jgi:hypothetical protein